MALLADAVTLGIGELGRIHDRAWRGTPQVLRRWTVAAFAGDGSRRKNRGPITIDAVGNRLRLARVAKQALYRDGTCEIGLSHVFIAGRQIVGLPLRVLREGRLKEVIAELNQIARRVIARADHVLHWILEPLALPLQPLPGSSVARVDGELSAGSCAERSSGLERGRTQRTGHAEMRITEYLLGMTTLAGSGVVRYSHAEQQDARNPQSSG